MALADLYREDGADHLTLAPGELIVAAHLPRPDAGSTISSAYVKLRLRGAIDFPLAGAAIACCRAPDDVMHLTVALTGTNSCPFLLQGLEPILPGDDREAALDGLEKLVQRQVSPQRTTTTAAHYRRLAISALVRRRTARLISDRGTD